MQACNASDSLLFEMGKTKVAAQKRSTGDKVEESDAQAIFFRAPSALRKRLRMYVAEQDVKLQDVLVQAVEEYLSKHT